MKFRRNRYFHLFSESVNCQLDEDYNQILVARHQSEISKTAEKQKNGFSLDGQ